MKLQMKIKEKFLKGKLWMEWYDYKKEEKEEKQ